MSFIDERIALEGLTFDDVELGITMLFTGIRHFKH